MNAPSNVVSGFPEDARAMAPSPAPPLNTRPLLWSVRRELWENRSIIIAPVCVASVILFGFFVSLAGLAERRRALMTAVAARQRALIEEPYDIAAFLILVTALLVAFFYCLDALNGERRDRSVLFWKSLPVSDLTTVLSKLSIPLVVLPLFIFPVIVVVQIIMKLVIAAVLAAHGMSAAAPWSPPLLEMTVGLLYVLIVSALWYAPIYGWLLMISGWARRATFLWAVLPPIGVAIFERIAFHTQYFAKFIGYRVVGWFTRAVEPMPRGMVSEHPLANLTPGRFLATPGLWLGLLVAAAFIAVAVRLRRNEDPI